MIFLSKRDGGIIAFIIYKFNVHFVYYKEDAIRVAGLRDLFNLASLHFLGGRIVWIADDQHVKGRIQLSEEIHKVKLVIEGLVKMIIFDLASVSLQDPFVAHASRNYDKSLLRCDERREVLYQINRTASEDESVIRRACVFRNGGPQIVVV